ncbi:hypothetical protein JKY72_01375 [Candidatus Gracilibacteria bacterium]|nr:hypothetical protein [Candidatus Gracilibacteria bacterium]
MLEVLFSLVFVLFIVYAQSSWVIILSWVALVVLLLPGLYSMIKGAPYIPSTKNRIEAILKLGDFGEGDRVIDIGCGDGRVIRAVANGGVGSAVGVEFSIPTYLLAKIQSKLRGKGEKVYYKDFWKMGFSEHDVIVCFLLDSSMKEFEEKIWPNLAKGTRVISNEFQMKGVETLDREGQVFLYVKK